MTTQPRTFLIGVTEPHMQGLADFLHSSGNREFYEPFVDAYRKLGPIALCSLYAKLCYRSLTEGKNANLTGVRDVQSNIESCFSVGHGSVFEHVQLNFVTINCSRIFTHELVRHRVGTAFSQTSGRYCTPESAQMVLPDDAPKELVARYETWLEDTKALMAHCRQELGVDDMDFNEKKQWTSMLRRAMPSGADNEIGWSVNIRSLRHILEMRTSPAAEWEMRYVFTQVGRMLNMLCPLLLHGGTRVTEKDTDLDTWTGLRV